MRATRAYLAGFGTTGTLLAGAALMFVLASAIVGFQGWPQVGDQPSAVSVQPVQARVPTGSRAAGAVVTAVTAGVPGATGGRGSSGRGIGDCRRCSEGRWWRSTRFRAITGTRRVRRNAEQPRRRIVRIFVLAFTAIRRLAGQLGQTVAGVGNTAGAAVSGAASGVAGQVKGVSPSAASAVQNVGSAAGGTVTGVTNAAGGVISRLGH